jgi:GntR family transcriptional regulator
MEIILPGEKIPSVREMSIMLETNPNTISKAYKELERGKIIETIKGRGTFISKNYVSKIDNEKMDEIYTTLKKIIIDSKYMGITKDKFLDMVIAVYSKLNIK